MESKKKQKKKSKKIKKGKTKKIKEKRGLWFLTKKCELSGTPKYAGKTSIKRLKRWFIV